MYSNKNIIIVGAFLGAFAIFLIIVLPRSFETGGSELASDGSTVPSEYLADVATYDLDPESSGVPSVISEVSSRIREELSGLSESSAKVDDVELLASRAADRLGLLIDPSFQEWSRIVRREGGSLPEWASDPQSSSKKYELWMDSAESISMSPISSGGIRARIVDVDQSPLEMTAPGTHLIRNYPIYLPNTKSRVAKTRRQSRSSFL